MNLKQMGPNHCLIQFENGNEIFLSYGTPVAGLTSDGYFRTAKKYSVTTTRHINKYLDGAKAWEVPQEAIDLLMTLGEELEHTPIRNEPKKRSNIINI